MDLLSNISDTMAATMVERFGRDLVEPANRLLGPDGVEEVRDRADSVFRSWLGTNAPGATMSREPVEPLPASGDAVEASQTSGPSLDQAELPEEMAHWPPEMVAQVLRSVQARRQQRRQQQQTAASRDRRVDRLFFHGRN